MHVYITKSQRSLPAGSAGKHCALTKTPGEEKIRVTTHFDVLIFLSSESYRQLRVKLHMATNAIFSREQVKMYIKNVMY